MRSRLLLVIVAASLLCLFVLRQQWSNAHAQDTIVWSADHEAMSEVGWYQPNDGGANGGEFNSGCAGVSPIQGFGRNPSGADQWPFSLVLTMSAPCGNTPQSGARMFRFREPALYPDLYYKTWYYFPQVFTPTDPVNPWWIIMSWKSVSTQPQRNDPFFNITISNRQNGNMFIHLDETKPYDPVNARAHLQTVIDVPVGQWFYIEALYKSRGDATGQVTVWQGDESSRVLLWDLQGVQTRYPDTEGGTVQWAVTSLSNGITPVPAQFAIDDTEIRRP